MIDDQGDAKCKCPTYFDGLHCEICKHFLNVSNPYEMNHYSMIENCINFQIRLFFPSIQDKCEANGKNVCENNGFCSIDQEGIVYCICSKQYEGQHCEIGKI